MAPREGMSGRGHVLNLKRRKETRERMLGQLFEEHGAALRGFLRARIGLQDDPEDVMQELFLKLAGMDDLLERLDPHSGSNRAFLLTAANNLMVDRERQQARQRKHRMEHSRAARNDVFEVTPEKIAQTEQELEVVLAAIKNLRPNCRQVFVLNRFDNKSYSQIATEMGVSVKQIEKYMSSALNHIREAARSMREKE